MTVITVVAIAAVLAIFVAFIVPRIRDSVTETIDDNATGTTQEACENAGGTWDDANNRCNE